MLLNVLQGSVEDVSLPGAPDHLCYSSSLLWIRGNDCLPPVTAEWSAAAVDGAAADMCCGYCFVILRRSGDTECSRRQRAAACSPASLCTSQARGMVRPRPIRAQQAEGNLLSALCCCLTMTQKQNKFLCFVRLCWSRAVSHSPWKTQGGWCLGAAGEADLLIPFPEVD